MVRRGVQIISWGFKWFQNDPNKSKDPMRSTKNPAKASNNSKTFTFPQHLFITVIKNSNKFYTSNYTSKLYLLLFIFIIIVKLDQFVTLQAAITKK